MQIGIPAETLPGETRVAATPETVKKLAAGGHHKVIVQAGAGIASSIPDADYAAAGATVSAGAAEAWASDIVLKVRGPQPAELGLLRKDQLLVGLLAPYKADALQALPPRAPPGSPWNGCRASRAPRAWTCCPPRPTSPATRRC
jgi:NAD(P) transhydrogenase subunit alpha